MKENKVNLGPSEIAYSALVFEFVTGEKGGGERLKKDNTFYNPSSEKGERIKSTRRGTNPS